ncbi:MAG: pantetheine-phosphate adenylyltransferase [Planctomycetota bacterium]|nr:MAG: pantetheine-phosphate adenylyltransferase [Planctomycetota bacterium]
MSSRIGLYAGSFDPVTLGHLDIIRRGARLVDKLIVSVGINPDKSPLFSPTERVEMLQSVLKEIPNVEVDCFEGLTVDHVHRRKAGVMIRGIRTVSDIESEFTMALTNRTLSPDIETVFLMASEKYSHISSSLIKQIALMGKDHSLIHLEQFIPKEVIPLLMAKSRH